MDRRGFAFFDVLIFIVIGLVLLAFAIPMIAKQIRNLNNAGTCAPENCRQSCASATEIQNFGKSCKDGVCCEPAPGYEPGGSGTGGNGTTEPKRYTLPSLSSPTLTATIAGNSVPGEVQVLQDAVPDPQDALLLEGDFYYHVRDACAKQDMDRPAGMAGPLTKDDTWQELSQIFTNPQDLVYLDNSSIRITITTKSGVINDSALVRLATPLTVSSTTTTYAVSGVGRFMINEPTTFPFHVSADGCVMQKPFTIRFLPSFAERYAGQKLKMTFTVTTVGKDSSVQRAVTYSVVPPIRHSAIGQQWTQSKNVDLWCNTPAVCADTYVYVAKFGSSGGNGVCPKANDTTKISIGNAKEMPLPAVKYCVVGMTDKQFENRGCFETEEDCRNKFPSLVVNQDYLTTVQQIAQYYGTTTDMTQYYTMFSNLQNSQRSPQCVQRSISGLETDTLYRVRDFDQKTQRGKVTLDMPNMTRGTLCVYGRDVYSGVGTGTAGSAASATFWGYNTTSNITIDTEPPVVNVSYDKFKLTLKMSCNDADSGCKQAMGVAYISDMSNYFRALGRGPSSAYLYCPPPKSGVYQAETRREIVYTAADVRVLCVKGEDNAGNGAVTMVTVFNAYDLLAKSIAVAVNGGTA